MNTGLLNKNYKRGNKMEKQRYEIKLIGRGGELNSTFSNNPWHPAKWMTYKGDIVKVFDHLSDEWLPDYYINNDGE